MYVKQENINQSIPENLDAQIYMIHLNGHKLSGHKTDFLIFAQNYHFFLSVCIFIQIKFFLFFYQYNVNNIMF